MPSLRPDPDRLDLGRWTPGNDRQPGREAFIPFCDGTRTCTGDKFAMTEAVLVLATIVARWRLCPSPDVQVRPAVAAVLLRVHLKARAPQRRRPCLNFQPSAQVDGLGYRCGPRATWRSGIEKQVQVAGQQGVGLAHRGVGVERLALFLHSKYRPGTVVAVRVRHHRVGDRRGDRELVGARTKNLTCPNPSALSCAASASAINDSVSWLSSKRTTPLPFRRTASPWLPGTAAIDTLSAESANRRSA